MKKPTIFFSHSSQDKETLAKLKDIFCQKTGGSVDVFLSSDGQSIPLGRNWVHRIQEALEEAAIMVIFITPNAIRSNWIYFESGFAYAKKIRVVPVGFLGIDLSGIHPPLSLLQGFNISSEDGLDNFIALANEEFSHNHSSQFTPEEYQEIISLSNCIESLPFGKYTPLIDNISVEVTEKDGLTCNPDKAIQQSIEYLINNDIKYSVRENNIITYGMLLYVDKYKPPKSFCIILDSLMINITMPIVKEILNNVLRAGLAGVSFSIDFSEEVKFLNIGYKITSRLFETGINFGEGDDFIYGDLAFSISIHQYIQRTGIKQGPVYLKIVPQKNEIDVTSIYDLISILFDRKVLYIKSEEYV